MVGDRRGWVYLFLGGGGLETGQTQAEDPDPWEPLPEKAAEGSTDQYCGDHEDDHHCYGILDPWYPCPTSTAVGFRSIHFY